MGVDYYMEVIILYYTGLGFFLSQVIFLDLGLEQFFDNITD